MTSSGAFTLAGNVADGCAKTPYGAAQVTNVDVPGLVVELANIFLPRACRLYWGMFATFVNINVCHRHQPRASHHRSFTAYEHYLQPGVVLPVPHL